MRFAIVLCGLALAGCVVPGPAHDTSYTATDGSFTGPDTLDAGWTRITLQNDGTELHQAVLVRLEDGHTVDDLLNAGHHLPEWAVGVGGPGVVAPGGSASAIALLEPGQHVMFDAIPNATGVPHFAAGMWKAIDVRDSGARSGLPAHDATIRLFDYGFDFDGVAAGDRVFRVENDGPEAHEAILLRLHGNVTVQDALAAMAPGADVPPPFDAVAGIGGLAPGAAGYFSAAMEPGRYALLCFLPTTEGVPHVAEGMVQEFTVA